MSRVLISLMAVVMFMMTSCGGRFEEPVLYAFDQTVMQEARAQIQSGKFLHMAAYDKLIAEAEDLLNQEPVSVMDKSLTAPSGDKHDYFSMAPYWWPNPKTSDGLPYIRKDGETNAAARNLDNKAMGQMESMVRKLALAYYFTADDRYAEKAIDQLRMWYVDPQTRMNPNMNYAQVVLGHNNNWGRSFGLIDKYGCVYLMDAIRILRSSKSFSDADFVAIQNWYDDFVEWMRTSKNGTAESVTKNNHATAYDAQIVAYALMAGREDVVNEVLSQFMQRRIYKQVQPDGSQPEELARTNSYSYTTYNIRIALSMCNMAQVLGVDFLSQTSEDGRSIPKMIEFMSQYLGVEQSQYPYEQINKWDSAQNQAYQILYWADGKFPDKGYDKILARAEKYKIAEASLFWLTGAVGMN